MSVETRSAAEAAAPRPGAPSRLARLVPRQTLLRHLLLVLLCGAALLLLSYIFDPFNDLRLATFGYYFAAVAGLTVLTGLSGQISLGHGALMAVGAYTTVLLISRQGWALLPALVAGTLATAVVGAGLGSVAARLRGPYLAGATLAFAVGLPALADKYPATFGGDNGLQANPPTTPAALGQSFPLERWQAWVSCIGALVVLFVLANLKRSRVGRAFRAVREDETAAQLAGLNVARTQVLAFVISAACAGLGGGLLVVVTSLAAPGAFTLALSLSLLTAIVLGGLGSLAGAAWGAAALVMLPSWTNDIANSFSFSTKVQANLPLVLYGLILIGVIVVAPQGIQGALRGGARFLTSRLAGRRRQAANEPHSTREESAG